MSHAMTIYGLHNQDSLLVASDEDFWSLVKGDCDAQKV